MNKRIDFQTTPEQYRHWRVEYDGEVARVLMDVDPEGGLFEGYELKLNSYDLGVDIELADIVQRMRFEHPEVKAVIVQSGKDNVFCAGANIRMLAGATHMHKVNFCKFTNETRNALEAAAEDSGQHYLCAVSGACAGGGYELAVACNYIILADDSASAVSLPEVPLLAVLPGTGGLTRLTDKRKVRRDLADVFCTLEEGIKGEKARKWRLVDEVTPRTKLEETALARARELAVKSSRPSDAKGVALTPLERNFSDDGVAYSTVEVEIDRGRGIATVTVRGPAEAAPADMDEVARQGAGNWMLRCARELDDAILHLRFNEPEAGIMVLRTEGDPDAVLAHEKVLTDNSEHWLANEILQLWKRVLKRLDLTSRSLVAQIEPGSCFAGVLAELAFAADRSYMALGRFEGDNRPEATLTLSAASFGPMPMSNNLTRLQTRFLGEPESIKSAQALIGETLDADRASELGLVTFAYDDIDWEEELRMFFEERSGFSPDALTGMEANLRFAGPETMETRIFGRLTAWQNWIFQRPNAVGEEGALRRYGTGQRPAFNRERV